ncbi:MAG: transposase [Treponema sp.]|nr:transposase [Treponema sp.]
MRKKRDFIEGAFYHVTSRTNDKIRVFENPLGRRIMLIVLQDAKDKFLFNLANFCIMPTHIHLLIQPREGTNLSMVMQWIKTRSAKCWNRIHGSTDHMWGHRYFARNVKEPQEFENTMAYIDQNPVKAGLAEKPEDWKASGAFYRAQNITGLVDLSITEQKIRDIFMSIPPVISKIIPPKQLEYTKKYIGVYTDVVENLNKIIPLIPKIDSINNKQERIAYLHYFTKTADYFIYEYDGEDTMYGKVRFNVYPAETEFRKFSLNNLKSNQFMELDYSWVVPE